MPGRVGPTYGRFARYYDAIYRDIVDYEADTRFLEAVFARFLSRKPHMILDIGCGTGNHDIPLARRGHAVTGIDLSAGMLALARRNAADANVRIRFVRGDMRAFDLHRTFDTALCMFGAFGYLLTPRDVLRSLRCVRRALASDGVFIFEFWQSSAARPPPHQSWLDQRSPEYEIVRLSEANFDAHTRRLPIEFQFLVLRDRRLVDRFNESHVIQTHPIGEVRSLLRRAGFDLLQTFAATNMKKGFERPTRETFRVMAVARPRAHA